MFCFLCNGTESVVSRFLQFICWKYSMIRRACQDKNQQMISGQVSFNARGDPVTAVLMNSPVFWDMTPCRLVSVYDVQKKLTASIYMSRWRWRQRFPPNRQYVLIGTVSHVKRCKGFKRFKEPGFEIKTWTIPKGDSRRKGISYLK
jgi:hypothetical protein